MKAKIEIDNIGIWCKKCWCGRHCGGDKYICLVPKCIMKVVKKK